MRNASRRIGALKELLAERVRERWFSTAGVIVVIPFSCALFGAYTSEVQKDFGTRVTVALWILALSFFAILAARLNPFGKSLLALAVENEEMEELIADLRLQKSANEKSVDLISYQSNYANGARSVVLNYVNLPVNTLSDLQKAIGDLASPLSFEKEFLFGTGADESWSFAVYLYSVNRDILIPVWRDKAKYHPSQSQFGREWGRGEGHVGKAFVDQKPIITGDTSIPEAAQFSTLPQGKAKPYDRTYVSFAAVPIGPIIAVDNRPYGVLVGTSDRAGRFAADNAGILVQIAGAIASLLIAGRLNVDNLLVPVGGAIGEAGREAGHGIQNRQD